MQLLRIFALCAFLTATQPTLLHAAALEPSVLARVKGATVLLKVTNAPEDSQGSGFYIGNDLVVTNAHVLGLSSVQDVHPAAIAVIFNSGNMDRESTVRGDVAGYNAEADLAFVKIAPSPGFGYPEPLSLAPAKEVRETMEVHIFGFPFGDALSTSRGNPNMTVAPGSVSSLRLDDNGFLAAIQVNGNINPGNSGGPIVDDSGRVVAVSVATIAGTQIGFAIPGDVLRKDLAGRVKSFRYTNIQRINDSYQFSVEAVSLDPLKKISSVTFHYWTGRPGELRPVHPEKKFMLHGAPGDSALRTISLGFDPRSKNWRGAVNNFIVNKGSQMWCRTSLTNAQGEILSGAIHAVEVTDNAVDTVPGLTFIPDARETPVPPPQVVTTLEPLSSVQESDEKGRSYARIKSPSKNYTLDKNKLLQVVSSPSGHALYAIFKDKPLVRVIDPATFNPIADITVPKSPVALWCDATRIVAACETAGVIVYIDATTRKIVHSQGNRDGKDLQPIQIIGRAPDRSLMTLWKPQKGYSPDTTLYHVNENGLCRRVVQATMDWCVYTHGGSRLWAQQNMGGSPSGTPSLYRVGTSERMDLESFKLFNDTAGFHRCFAHCFVTQDLRHLVLPAAVNGKEAYEMKTFLVSPDLRPVGVEFRGVAITEVPGKNIFITWSAGERGKRGLDQPEICYVDRLSGRPLRKILATGLDPHPGCFQYFDKLPNVIYVPGHELLVYRDKNSSEGNVSVIRCGPLENDPALKKAPVAQAANAPVAAAPPDKATVGKFLAYTPPFTKPVNAKDIRFKLDKGIEGMLVDLSTGKLNFNPAEEDIGKHVVTILAEVDGVDVPVISWILEVVK